MSDDAPCFGALLEEISAEYPHASNADVVVLALGIASEANPALASWLERYGVNFPHALNLLEIITCHAIRTAGRTFEIVTREEGEASVIFPVNGEDGKAVDLIAFRPDDPMRWWLFLDQGAVLGAVNIANPASYVAGPMTVHMTPLAWLQAGCAGVCILNAPRARAELRKAVGPLAATDIQHARRLARSLAPEVSPDRIMVPVARAA